MSGISLTCFAASYAVAWLLELAQLVCRSRRAAVVRCWALSLAGLLAHTLYLGYRVVELSASPLVEQLRLVPGGRLAADRRVSCI